MNTAQRVEAKIEFLSHCAELMPSGNPNYLGVVKYPMIKSLLHEKGNKFMLSVIVLLVKDFCASMNVVRNMNEDQMLEAASMLLDECGNFRLEDYVMMFQMAKRGELFDIHDRIDLQVITRMLDVYWAKRHNESEKMIVEEITHLDSIGGSAKRTNEKDTIWDDEKGYIQTETTPQKFDSLLSQYDPMKKLIEDKIGNREERKRLAKIEKEDSEKIRTQLKERGYDANK